MKTALRLAAALAIVDMGAALTVNKRIKMEKKGIDLESLYRREQNSISKAARSIQVSENRSHKLKSAYHAKQQRLGSTFDEEFNTEEQHVLEYVCQDGDIDNCDQEKVDYVKFAFETAKGLVVGISAVYSDTCRSGLVGVVDSCLNIYDHIALYLPENFNKFGIAISDFTQATNITFTNCDLTHFFNEMAKLGDWQNWEQYIEIAFRAGGVMIQDMWTNIDHIKLATKASDGYATGLSVGDLISLFLDTLL